MTGPEARAFIVAQIAEHHRGKPGDDPSAMNLNWELAYDLMKCGKNDIGALSAAFAKDGIKAFEKHKLFGMTVDIDWDETKPTVEFGA